MSQSILDKIPEKSEEFPALEENYFKIYENVKLIKEKEFRNLESENKKKCSEHS